MVIVNLAMATICFLNQCYPALVGEDTPTGQFKLEQAHTKAPGYGGDIIVFYESTTFVYAIHRPWVLNANEQRVKRLAAGTPNERVGVTRGCINVMPDVYKKLQSCCSNATLIITHH